MIGVVLTGVGVLGAFGSITGNLPSMMGALFYPSLLTTASNAGAQTKKIKAAKATTGVKSPFTTKPATKGEGFWQKLTTGQLWGQLGN
jgi:hypothetical protein